MQTVTVRLPAQHCKSLPVALACSAQQIGKAASRLRLWFEGPAGERTLIEDDADLMAVRYCSRGAAIAFQVEVGKSERQLMRQMIAEETQDYLQSVYGAVEEREVSREANKVAQEYLLQLYEQIGQQQQREEEQVCREEVSEYVRGLSDSITAVAAKWPRKRAELAGRRGERRSESMERGEKAELIEEMVSRSLKEMLPAMVSQLTGKIVASLRKLEGKGRVSGWMNPEEM